MKERPILFNADMVRAILDGRKTQTRRVVKLPKKCEWLNGATPGSDGLFFEHGKQGYGHVEELRCNHGQPGDRLWVREAWKYVQGGAVYDAAGGMTDSFDDEILYRASAPAYKTGWTPSIHMPRWASRITLEITDVRVERLQDISEADARSEGVQHSQRAISSTEAIPCFWDYIRNEPNYRSARDSFSSLWWSINGTGSWDVNPWVWVIEFKRLEAGNEN